MGGSGTGAVTHKASSIMHHGNSIRWREIMNATWEGAAVVRPHIFNSQGAWH
jgi:hypothetical protein